ncbi:MAG: sodium-translocating pyrophosphatase [Thermosulfidibacteraceae bacterium]|jgi:K(+)-stimulated pyrophosphate-energized sodium pump
MMNNLRWLFYSLLLTLLIVPSSFASEADIVLPDLSQVYFFGGRVHGVAIMYIGLLICVIGLLFSLFHYKSVAGMKVHEAMEEIGEIIWQTCKAYLKQQAKFLFLLWAIVAVCIVYYFGVLSGRSAFDVIVILISSVIGILGSFSVAVFGMRINTKASPRTAFVSLYGTPFEVVKIPLHAGMSVGLMLVSVELFIMICILVFLKDLAGPCFIGFAIGESLGAAALRVAGGIFTKIADVGADQMKIEFKLPEDDPRNPGVIADNTGDNAGDSVGPTADGFETYGVTGVALITFLAVALGGSPMSAVLIIWIFTMRVIMILTSLIGFYVSEAISSALYGGKEKIDMEKVLINLVWLTSIISIILTFVTSYLLLSDYKQYPDLWWVLSIIISCGTIAGAIIPEFTKVFTSFNSRHVKEIVTCSNKGGAALNILSGFVAGCFSSFWEGLAVLVLMLIAYIASHNPSLQNLMPPQYPFAASIFAFGLVAFGFLSMGPVTIAVDSYGPPSDNAQSVYELSRIESRPDVIEDIKKRFGFTPNLDRAKHYLEEADGVGNTFKASAKPVLIATAVVGATTLIFGIIVLLEKIYGNAVGMLSLVQPWIILGFVMGGAVIYWFTGASTQAVVAGAYYTVDYIKKTLKLDAEKASVEDSKEVVRICTRYAQKGMLNIFAVIFSVAIGMAFLDPYAFIAYLIAIAFFGLFQAIFLANSGGAWDNAKKVVEVDMKAKGTDLHAYTVVGDTVGDPFKDTSSVSMNPIIKFTTLFGLLATEISVTMQNQTLKNIIGIVFMIIAFYFVYRTFYAMTISKD